MLRQPLALLAILLAAAASARAEVIVVSPSDTMSVDNAVNAAADGDILLLKPNAPQDPWGYPTIIDGKGLTLVAEGSVTLSHVIVRNLAAGQRVVLRGLRVGVVYTGSFGFEPNVTGAIDVVNCAGPVWIDACELVGPDAVTGCFGGCSFSGVHGLRVGGSADVVATDCTMVGGAGGFEHCPFIVQCDHASAGGDGATVLDSRLALLRCTLTGGAGGGKSPPDSFYAKPSGRGVIVAGNSFVHLAGGQVQGGPQQPQNLGPGAGLKIADAAAWVQLRGTALLSGTGSPPAPPLDAPFGNFTQLTAPPRGLQVSSPVRVDAPGEIHISALPGDLVAIFESPAGAWQSLPAKQGVFLLGAPVLGPVFAAVDVTGDWTLPFLGPHVLPPGSLGVTVLLQLLVKQGPTLLVEDVASCTLLDASVP